MICICFIGFTKSAKNWGTTNDAQNDRMQMVMEMLHSIVYENSRKTTFLITFQFNIWPTLSNLLCFCFRIKL